MVEDRSPAIYLERSTSDGANTYYCILTHEPVPSMKIKMTVVAINPNDRYIDYGLVSEERFNSLKGSLNNNWASTGNYSYCGYHISNVTGISLTTSASDSIGFREGFECFMEYDQALGKLKYYDNEGKVDLKADLTPGGNYYFFCTMYYPVNKCTLERIE